MNATLLKTLIAMAPVSMLVFGSVLVFSRAKAASSLLQLVGTASMLVMVLTHLCEALDLFPWMQWGLERSAGHYLDLLSAILGVTLFPIGYLWTSLRMNPRSKQRV
jgi:hypothetical protein